MRSSSRSVGIDVVRIVGLVAVVAGHVWTNTEVVRLLYPWHVPLFFFLTGWFWRADRPLSVELTSRWRTLLRPYIAWLGIVGVAWSTPLLGEGSVTVTELVRPLLGGQYIGRPFSAFWFVTALAGSAVLMRSLQGRPGWFRWTLALLAVATAVVAPGVVRLPPWSLGTAVATSVFLLAGTSARRWSSACRRPALVGALLLLLGASAVLLGARPLDLKQADFGTPIISVGTAAVICTGLVLLGGALDGLVPRRAAVVVSDLAAVGIGVVLLHALVLWLLPPQLPHWAAFCLALGGSWSIALLVSRTPLAPWLLGITPIRRGGRRRGPGNGGGPG